MKRGRENLKGKMDERKREEGKRKFEVGRENEIGREKMKRGKGKMKLG